MTGETAMRVLNYIDLYVAENEWAPTVREIADGVGLSSSASVHRQLDALEADGHIERLAGSPRALRVVRSAA